MTKPVVSPQFELAKLYYDRCDIDKATELFTVLCEQSKKEKNWLEHLKCLNFLLRISAELEDFDRVNVIKESLQDLVLNEGVEITSKTYYTLGMCTFYKKQFDMAMDYFQKSLNIAFSKNDKEDICYAINGMAITYYATDRLSEALKEIYNLKVFFEVLDIPALKISNLMLNGHILRKLGRLNEALEIFWECYESLKSEKNMFMYVSLLYGMGLTYQDKGEVELTKTYLKLAKSMVSPDHFKRQARAIDEKLEELGVRPHNDYDLIFDSRQNMVTERKRGKVDFKNQFILLDLLHLFMQHPGETFSKEILVKRIWKQDYNPAIHDNKIYVTIKRLRQIIEPDVDHPKYIFRAKNGYYLNKSTRVLLEH
ncbi:MAG: winged helix-turn-helix domain-containing protein [Pseudomonadota bacterium]|nr:winged helix-turn-helix domain-containing protein [Pseudomonadota bacterium]